MSSEISIAGAARAVLGVAPSVLDIARPLQSEEGSEFDPSRWAERGYIEPAEDEELRCRWAAYLTARAVLHETVWELRAVVFSADRPVDDATRIRAFAIGYTAACLLVRAGRFLVNELAPNVTARSKLDEAAPHLGVPRKSFTAVYRSLTRPLNAWRLRQARSFAAEHRREIAALRSDPVLGPVLELLTNSQEALGVDVARYAKGRLRFRWHSWRRRNSSAIEQALFSVFEISGRVFSEMRLPWYRKRLVPAARRKLAAVLEPGDVIVTRHNDAATNLFLPGYWIHSALHIGPASTQETLGLRLDPDRASRWTGDIRVLEARKDGVLLRPLEETFQVDAVAVVRPEIGRADLARALERAFEHEGKLFDFSFDFRRSDRLACTELVYRAYHGVGGLSLEPRRRAGRVAVSSEQILDLALDGRGFRPVAVFGAPGCRWRVATGEDARAVLAASYRRR